MKWSIILMADSPRATVTIDRLIRLMPPGIRIDDMRHREPYLEPQVAFHADDPNEYKTLLYFATTLGQASIR